MIISSQGFGHFVEGLNNQDFGMESSRCALILDGCSGAKYSEVGTRLFAQLLTRKEEWDSEEKFEDTIKSVFDELIEMMKPNYSQEDVESQFIMENLLFTIIACFETEKEYIVKLFGDEYIVTQNKKGMTSYMKYAYGKCPPYFAYRYCENVEEKFRHYQFKTFHFDKEVFPKVAIATDGIMPIAKGEVGELDNAIITGNETLISMAIRSKRQSFYDDVTIGIVGGRA